MRHAALILTTATLLLGCQDIPSRGVFVPAEATGPTARASGGGAGTGGAAKPAAPKAAPTGPQGGYDFEANDRKDEEDDAADADPVDLQADLLGIDKSELVEPAPRPKPAGPGVGLPGIPTPQWQPDQPIDGSWGMRVVATLHDVQPPRAVVAMPDGAELVVQPGQMLPNYRMVVLAVGRNAVQVARVTPQGFYAKVETETVASLAPAAVAPTPAR